MAGPLLLSDNLFNTVAYPLHVITADEQATGHEIQNIADGRRSQYDYYTSVTANTERTLKVQCDIVRSVNTIFLDRGHNLTDKSIAYEHSANGSSWTTAWTFCPTGLGTDLRVGNYLLQSQAMATSPWTNNLTTVTNNNSTAPDGTVTATALVPTASSSNDHNVKSGAITITSAENIAASIYLRASSYNGAVVRVTDGPSSNFFGASFGLSTVTVLGSSLGGAGALTGSSITDVGNNWRRLTIYGKVNGGVTSVVLHVIVFDTEAHAAALTAYAGDTANGMFAWGAQVERNGSTATDAKAYTRTVAAIAAGAVMEDGAWGYTFTAASNFYHRIRIPAMGTGLVPVVVGAWLGTAYQPSFLYMPSADDGATFTRPGTTTEWGWRGGGPPVVTRDGTLNIKFASVGDYTTARPFLVKQFAAGRPMWICHDQAQADRTILAMFPDGARIDPRFDSGWFPRQVQIPYVEHEPKRQ